MRKFDYMEEAPEILVEALTLFDQVRRDFIVALRTRSGGVMPELAISLTAEHWSMENLLAGKYVPCVKVEGLVELGGSEPLPREGLGLIRSMGYWEVAVALKQAWNSFVDEIPEERRGKLSPFEDLRGEFPA